MKKIVYYMMFISVCALSQTKIKLINPKKVIFGTKYNFYQRLTGKITKEEYQENRLYFINLQGDCCEDTFFRFKCPT